ncbi:MAG: hypothetical protein HUJ96_01380 [Marinilabiliaceae bacterium]|nr:hypothetical protein [Marinilabiliaceae bacterium]
MRFKNFLAITTLTMATIAFTSCEDDNEDGKYDDILHIDPQDVHGEFTGSLHDEVTVNGRSFNYDTVGEVVEVTFNDDNTMNITLRDFRNKAFDDYNCGDLVASNIEYKINKEKSGIEFSGDFTSPLTMEMKGVKAEYKASGNVAGIIIFIKIDDTSDYYQAISVQHEFDLPVSPNMTVSFKTDYQGSNIFNSSHYGDIVE